MIRLSFLVNPIAGMGGRVGLKGTDGVVDRALELGAHPVANLNAKRALQALHALLEGTEGRLQAHWLTCSGPMGADCLADAGFTQFDVVYDAPVETSAHDTKASAQRFLELDTRLILFCGGDGTARDICSVTRKNTPILGIPSGVKMYSGVFGTNPASTAEILLGYLEGRLTLTEVDILDLDEDRYRQGEWSVRLYDVALTPFEPTYTQAAKLLITESTEDEIKQAIAEHLVEEMEATQDLLVLLGPGSTVEAVARRLEVDKTLLGVDALANGKLVGSDLNEHEILKLLDRYPHHRLVLSPIGAQGFVLGRGNLQLSPAVIRRIGRQNIVVAATPAKLARTPVLRFDTGDAALDATLAEKGYLPVVTGYHTRKLVKVKI